MVSIFMTINHYLIHLLYNPMSLLIYPTTNVYLVYSFIVLIKQLRLQCYMQMMAHKIAAIKNDHIT